MIRKRALAYQYLEEYDMFQGERFYGFYSGRDQVLFIRDDFDLIERIVLKDFEHFQKSPASILTNTIPADKNETFLMKGEGYIFFV